MSDEMHFEPGEEVVFNDKSQYRGFRGVISSVASAQGMDMSSAEGRGLHEILRGKTHYWVETAGRNSTIITSWDHLCRPVSKELARVSKRRA